MEAACGSGDWREAAAKVGAAQPAMAPLVKLARRVARAGSAEEARAISREFRERLEYSAERIARHAVSLLRGGAVVLTHSRSETVETALKAAARADVLGGVIVTESRPLGEGEALARSLGEAGIAVRLVADSEIWRAMGEADVAWVGADAVWPGWVVNKVGTSLVALAARARGKACYVLCGEDKRLEEALAVRGELFEAVPAEWFTAVVSEEGSFSVR